ncbi:MAG: MaoC family dehydratase [Bacteroidales bacterium]|nr:MaoC family dehydratase [Bacteroidales bacterium]
MEKIKEGDIFEFETVYHQKDVETFAQISGDNNPIHINQEYAKKTPFGECIVHGFFAGAVFSRVFGTKWPGEGTIYMNQEMSFRAPVFVEKKYTAKFKVLEVNQEKHRGVIECILEAEDGKQAIIGKAMLMHKERF